MGEMPFGLISPSRLPGPFGPQIRADGRAVDRPIELRVGQMELALVVSGSLETNSIWTASRAALATPTLPPLSAAAHLRQPAPFSHQASLFANLLHRPGYFILRIWNACVLVCLAHCSSLSLCVRIVARGIVGEVALARSQIPPRPARSMGPHATLASQAES